MFLWQVERKQKEQRIKEESEAPQGGRAAGSEGEHLLQPPIPIQKVSSKVCKQK